MFSNLSLSGRLLSAFGAIAVAAVFAGVTAIVALGKVNEQAHALYAHHMVGLETIDMAHTELIQVARYRALFATAGTQGKRDKYHAAFQQHIASTQNALRNASSLLQTPKNHLLIGRVQADFDAYLSYSLAYVDAVAATALPSVSPAIDGLNSAAVDTFKTVTDGIVELADSKPRVGAEAATESARLYSSSQAILIAFFGFSALVSAGFGVAIARSLANQLGGEPSTATLIARRIASGDRSEAIEVESIRPGSSIAEISMMQARLREIVGDIRQSSQNIAVAAAEISNYDMSLNVRTEMQTASLQQTASSMEQITPKVGQNTENAVQANNMVSSASEAAHLGGRCVAKVIETIRGINVSTRKAGDIAGVIEGIAF